MPSILVPLTLGWPPRMGSPRLTLVSIGKFTLALPGERVA